MRVVVVGASGNVGTASPLRLRREPNVGVGRRVPRRASECWTSACCGIHRGLRRTRSERNRRLLRQCRTRRRHSGLRTRPEIQGRTGRGIRGIDRGWHRAARRVVGLSAQSPWKGGTSLAQPGGRHRWGYPVWRCCRPVGWPGSPGGAGAGGQGGILATDGAGGHGLAGDRKGGVLGSGDGVSGRQGEDDGPASDGGSWWCW